MTDLILHSDLQISIEAAKDLFNRCLDASPTTRQEYGRNIKDFIEFLYSARLITDKGLDKHCLLSYKLNYLDKRVDIGVGFKYKYISTAKAFLRILHEEGVLEKDFSKGVKNYKIAKGHKRDGLNKDEVLRINGFIRSMDESPANSRLKAIIALLLLQGLRQIEVIRLNVEDLHLNDQEPYCEVLGKGRDEKEKVFLNPLTAAAIKDYQRLNNIKSGALFVSYSNNSKNKRLTTKTIRVAIKEVFNRLSIENCTHGFRHYFVTELIETYKSDLTQVRNWTRHKSLDMLLVYNDAINHKRDIPRFVQTFSHITF